MLNFLKRLFMLGNPDIKGELVYGKKKGESKPCYIPFSKNSGSNPVIATEQYVNIAVNSAKSSSKVFKGSIADKERSVFECQLFRDILLRFDRNYGKIQVTIYSNSTTGVQDFSMNYTGASPNGVTTTCINNTLLKDSVILDKDCLQNSETNISLIFYRGDTQKLYELKAIVASGAKLIIVSMREI